MPMWQVVVVLNLMLAVGLGLGYAGWGRRAEAVDREAVTARAQVERLEREKAACAAGGRAGEQAWTGRGIVRAAYPQLLVITHEEIRGLLAARTTGFPLAPRRLGEGLQVGDPIRFSLRGTLVDDVKLVAIEPW